MIPWSSSESSSVRYLFVLDFEPMSKFNKTSSFGVSIICNKLSWRLTLCSTKENLVDKNEINQRKLDICLILQRIVNFQDFFINFQIDLWRQAFSFGAKLLYDSYFMYVRKWSTVIILALSLYLPLSLSLSLSVCLSLSLTLCKSGIYMGVESIQYWGY